MFMNKIIHMVRKIGKLVIIILSFTYAALFSICAIGRGATQGQFMPVLASLILMGVGTAAIASVGLLLLLKKEVPAKLIFAALGIYWVIYSVQDNILMADNMVKEMPGVLVAASVFGFIIGLLLLGVSILLVLYYAFSKTPRMNKKPFLIISLSVLGTILVFSMVKAIILAIAYGKYGGWVSILSAIADGFIAPPLLIIGYLYFFVAPYEVGIDENFHHEESVAAEGADQPEIEDYSDEPAIEAETPQE